MGQHRISAPHRNSAGFFAVGHLVYFIFGLIEILLALRFLLVFFGVNSSNTFVAFILNTSAPLIAPFQGILDAYSTARFEWATLIALVVFAVVGGLLASLLRPPAGTRE